MKRLYRVGSRNSTVGGSPGRTFDWSEACWDGSAIYEYDCGRPGHPKEMVQAPLPYVDDGLIAANCQHLHVPWRWATDMMIFRVRPNDSMEAGRVYRGRLVQRQRAVQV